MKIDLNNRPKRAGIVFSGGPAPGANTVISAVTLTFLNHGVPVVGFLKGFEYIEDFKAHDPSCLREDLHYMHLTHQVSALRNQRGVFLKTSRANPGRSIRCKEDLDDPERSKRLHNIVGALACLDVGVLVTIGGDDTLKTANYLHLLGVPVVHVPKTIDNDYYGIAWTFGYWTAVDMAQDILLNLRGDAEATDSWFVVELMGRKAGWITYAAGIAGMADKMIALEDMGDGALDVDTLAGEVVDLIVAREREDKGYGMICLAEGLAERLPESLRPKEVDRHGNLLYGKVEVGGIVSEAVSRVYHARTGRKKKVTYKQVGYETRSRGPISFDVVLGAMLGYGAFKLVAEEKFGHMVSVSDNFDIRAIPFGDLVDPETLVTKLRNVPKGSDFYTLKEALSYRPSKT
jgi:6-phosphofructokinase 1